MKAMQKNIKIYALLWHLRIDRRPKYFQVLFKLRVHGATNRIKMF